MEKAALDMLNLNTYMNMFFLDLLHKHDLIALDQSITEFGEWIVGMETTPRAQNESFPIEQAKEFLAGMYQHKKDLPPFVPHTS